MGKVLVLSIIISPKSASNVLEIYEINLSGKELHPKQDYETSTTRDIGPNYVISPIK